MCGLVGVAGDVTFTKYKDLFTDLLLVDQLRGMHSTGVAFVPRYANTAPKTLKMLGPSTDLIRTVDYQASINMSNKCVIGHNRFATKGAVTTDNAHPFKFSKVIGAHNGTLDTSSHRSLHRNNDFDTDSEALYCHLNEYGLRDTVDNLQGAWALTWFDTTDNSINFLRNSKRPLHYTYNDDKSSIFWASESSMLEFLVARSGIKTTGKIHSVDTDKHMKWIIPDNCNKPLVGPTVVEMKPKEIWTSMGSYESSYLGAYRGRVYEGNGYRVTVKDKKSVVQSDLPFDVVKKLPRIDTSKFRPPYKDYKGNVLTKSKFFEYVQDGCVLCDNHTIDWGDFIYPVKDDLDGRHIFLCEHCYNDDDSFDCLEYLI